MTDRKKISVLGSGSWGTAVASLLAGNGHQVTLWSFLEEECEELKQFHENKRYLKGVILPDSICFTHDIREAVEGQQIVINATPSFAVRGTVQKLQPYFDREKQIIVNIAKGLRRILCCAFPGYYKCVGRRYQALRPFRPVPRGGSGKEDAYHQCGRFQGFGDRQNHSGCFHV